MARLIRIAATAAIVVGIAACGTDDQRREADGSYDNSKGINLSGILGTTKTAPDEFAVITTKPLKLPKDFTALPTPTPGVRSALSPDPIAEARTLLLGETDPQPANARVSASESALLASTNTGAVDPNIRTVLDAEQSALEASRPSYALESVFPSIRRDANADDLVKASEERVRLSETLPSRTIGSTELATIPTAVAPPASPPTAAPAPILPTANPTTGGELIYIPE